MYTKTIWAGKLFLLAICYCIRKSPMDSGTCVRASVSSGVAHFFLFFYFFLIFCMKLGVHKGSKVMEPNFSGELKFGQFFWGKMALVDPSGFFGKTPVWPKMAQNVTKMNFLDHNSKLFH